MSFESPISVLQNLAGDEVAIVSGSAMGSTQPGVAVLAKDESGNAQFLNLNASGELKVQATVDVALSASTDSILVYGSADVALQQDGERANSLKTYDAYVSGAIDNMGLDLNAFASANHTDLTAIDASVGDVETAVTNASSAISGSVVALGADLNAFASANHTDLTAIDASVGDVETAVNNASSAISGSVVALGADLNAFASANHTDLTAIDASVGDVETAVTNASSAISGSVVALGADLNAFASANHTDLGALSSSLDRFHFNGSNELMVNAAVDVALSASTDSITVWGDRAALVQDAADDYLLVRDTDLSGAIDSLGGDLNAFASANHTDLLAIDASVADVETAVNNASSAISGSVVGLGADLNAFASANHTDLTAIDASVGDVETAVNNASSAISGSVVSLGADLNAFASANHTDLTAIDASVGDVETAVNNASSAISGSVVALGSDLNAFASANHTDLTAIDASVGDVETAVNNASSAISGSIVALGADLGNKLDQFTFDSNALVVTGNLNVDVSLTQADEVTAFQGGAPWSVSATDLDIRDLTYVSDSVSIYGDEAVPFAQISGSGEMITVPLGSEGNSLLQAASGSIWSDVNGNGALLVGLLGSNSKNVLASSPNDILYVSGAGEFAISNMVDVSALATEATLGSVLTAIGAIDAAQLGTLTVTATDLDIRDLSSTTDSVSAVQSGDWIVRKQTTSAAVSTASANTSDAEVLALNADRMGATFFMDGNATCYIKLGGAASSSDFSVRIVNNGYYELPEGYTGSIHAAFSVTDAGIKLRITELSYV